MASHDPEYWVIGAGLAGALAVHRLRLAGKEVAWFDRNISQTATRTGAGIMNPITGRKFVFSWEFDGFHQEALQVYSQLESKEQPILHRLSILKGLSTPGDVNNWCMRVGSEPYSRYIQEPRPGSDFPFLQNCLAMGEISPVYRVDMQAVVDQVIQRWGPPDTGEMTAVGHLKTPVGERDIPDRGKLILATGSPVEAIAGLQLPLSPYQGQALIIRTQDLPTDRIIHHKLKVVPYGDDLFWVGTFDQWEGLTESPTEQGRLRLEEELARNFSIRYTEVDQVSGIRPASRTRRPFTGPLPGHPNTYVINGLGTKGASLAPLVVRNLCDHLLHGREIWKELNLPPMT